MYLTVLILFTSSVHCILWKWRPRKPYGERQLENTQVWSFLRTWGFFGLWFCWGVCFLFFYSYTQACDHELPPICIHSLRPFWPKHVYFFFKIQIWKIPYGLDIWAALSHWKQLFQPDQFRLQDHCWDYKREYVLFRLSNTVKESTFVAGFRHSFLRETNIQR